MFKEKFKERKNLILVNGGRTEKKKRGIFFEYKSII